MNLLIISAPAGRVGIFATDDPKGLRAEIGDVVQIDQHYTIASSMAREVEKAVRRHFAPVALGMDAAWFATTFAQVVAVASLKLQELGGDQPVIVGGTRHPVSREARCAV